MTYTGPQFCPSCDEPTSLCRCEKSGLPKEMVAQLADLCFHRYHSALGEGLTERQIFAELVTIILETYREAMAS